MTRTPSRKQRKQRGFTLVEAIISAGLLGLLAVTATWFWVDSFKLVRNVNADSAGIASARASLERLAREIREVKLAGGAYCVSTLPAAQPTATFGFKKDCIVGVGSCAPAVVGCTGSSCAPKALACGSNDFDVTVAASGGNLLLSYAGTLASPVRANAVMVANVSNFGVRFLDAANTVVSGVGGAATVRYVELSLTIQPPDVQATTASTVVALRNN